MSIPIINFAEYTVVFEAQEEDISMRHHFIKECGWAEAQFRKIQNYAWFCARVSIWKDGEELTYSYLGACCYKTEREFFTRYIGDYFADMVSTCVDEINDAGLSAMVNLWLAKVRK